MLLSLIKILLFVALVTAAAFGAGYLMESSGGVQIVVGGTEYTLGPLQAVIALLVLIVAVWLGIKLVDFLIALFKFINGDETALSRHFDRNRTAKGLDALSGGLSALAVGDGKAAMQKAAHAERLLNKPELTNVLAAKGAEIAGDTKKAEQINKKLLENEKTRFIGVNGLLKQKLSEGDTETATQLAQRAFALEPKHEETQDTLLKLQARNEDWTGAKTTLDAKLKSGTLPRDVYRRRNAVLTLTQAHVDAANGETTKARDAAYEANRLSPDLVPAAVMAARYHIADGQARYATRLLKKTWKATPHPDIARAFAEIDPDESPEARLKRFRGLVSSNKDHPEASMLMAELNIAAEDFPEARRALGDLVETQPTSRVLTIMAAIEKGEGKSDNVVQGWLARAVQAPRGPQWVCDNCHTVSANWEPVCKTCESFDRISWVDLPEPEVLGSNSAMLPLLVSAGSEAPDTAAGALVTMGDDVVDVAAEDITEDTETR